MVTNDYDAFLSKKAIYLEQREEKMREKEMTFLKQKKAKENERKYNSLKISVKMPHQKLKK